MQAIVKEIILDGIPVTFLYIDADSKYYKDAVDLRFSVFYKEFDLDINIINDSDENTSIHLAVVAEEKVIGFGRLSLYDGTARISQMVVNRNMRGRGIGSGIMNILIERSIKEGCRLICLNSRMDAVSFYRKFGFEEAGNEFPSKKTGLTHIRMEKKLEV
jgi:predicted GNAT family N-acyltransferase